MKYAIQLDNKFLEFEKLPKIWNQIIGFRESATPEEIYKQGFRELITPLNLAKYQSLGAIYKDDINDVFKYALIDSTPTVQELYNEKYNRGEEMYKEYKRMLFEANYEDVVLGVTSEAFKILITSLVNKRNEIRNALKQYMDENNLEALKSFTYETEEAQQLRTAIKNFKN